jgi:hypothetical protein
MEVFKEGDLGEARTFDGRAETKQGKVRTHNRTTAQLLM